MPLLQVLRRLDNVDADVKDFFRPAAQVTLSPLSIDALYTLVNMMYTERTFSWLFLGSRQYVNTNMPCGAGGGTLC